jgi:Ran GTPase-activating protein (RanGAP) involved in mRNA processing and transport
MPKYDDVDGDYEYLDLSGTSMSYTDLLEVLCDLSGDTMLKQVDLSTLITLEDATEPYVMEEILYGLQGALETNTTLTALDFVGNHLGDFGPCSGSRHRLDYLKELTSSLLKSSITRLDLSSNNILGPHSRVLSSFSDLLRLYGATHCHALRCQKNSLHNQAFSLISAILGPFSVLTELDLSDNLIGLDPFGNQNSEMMRQVCVVLGQTHSLVKLSLARNSLTSEDVVYLSEAIQKLPGLNFFDISGNHLTETGVPALADALQGHANLRGRFTQFPPLSVSRLCHTRLLGMA